MVLSHLSSKIKRTTERASGSYFNILGVEGHDYDREGYNRVQQRLRAIRQQQYQLLENQLIAEEARRRERFLHAFIDEREQTTKQQTSRFVYEPKTNIKLRPERQPEPTLTDPSTLTSKSD